MAKCKNCDYPYASGTKCSNCGTDKPNGSGGSIGLIILIIIIIAAVSKCGG